MIKKSDLVKRAYAVVAVIGCLHFGAQASGPTEDNPVFYSVPDIPAFKALGTEPTSALKPSSPEDLSAAASEFYRGKEIVIPNAFALEVSPGQLWSHVGEEGKQESIPNPWSDSRISLATKRDSASSISSMAIGFRITFVERDYRTDKKFREDVQRIEEVRLLRNVNALRNKFIEEFQVKFGYTELQFAENQQAQQAAKEYAERRIAEMDPASELKAIRKKFADTTWNSQKLDLAIAISGSSPDTLARNLEFSGFYAWLSYVRPIGDNKSGQLLLTGSFTAGYDYALHESNFTPAVTARTYFGKNEMKAYGEFHARYVQIDEKLYASGSLGTETQLGNGVWLEFQSGMERDVKDGRWAPKTNTSLKWNLAAFNSTN